MTPAHAIRQKIARLEAGGRPRVLDLFAGCGGLSLGFQAAGFEIAAAVELDPLAAASHGINFHPSDRRHWLWRDITATSPEQLAHELRLGPVPSTIDVIVGGHPAKRSPGFAEPSSARLRSTPRPSGLMRGRGYSSTICATSSASSRSRSWSKTSRTC